MTDPIADMLTRMRNATLAGKKEVVLPASKIKLGLAAIFKEEGFVEDAEEISGEGFKNLRLVLKYKEGRPVIQSIKRVSKPGRRVYAKSDNLPVVLNNLGIAILSTSQGLMTNRKAKKAGLGGELLCEIY